MENTAYLDTHAAVWLYNNELKKFPQATLELIENSDCTPNVMFPKTLRLLAKVKC